MSRPNWTKLWSAFSVDLNPATAWPPHVESICLQVTPPPPGTAVAGSAMVGEATCTLPRDAHSTPVWFIFVVPSGQESPPHPAAAAASAMADTNVVVFRLEGAMTRSGSNDRAFDC